MPSREKRKGKYGTGTPARPATATQSNPTFRVEFPALAADAQRNAYFELYSAACYRASKASSEATTEHFNRICQIRVGDAYRRAYARWEQLWSGAGAQCEKLAFSNRLLIGLSNPSLWESSITLNPTYGTPVIPGSACKGLARHFAESYLHLLNNKSGLTRKLSDALFGRADDAGEVCFQDAWWVPDSAPELDGKDRPFVREVVTPHHKDFLDRSGGVEATPFDSPVPIPQIAAHGRFLFVVTGSALWAAHALDILRLALLMEGIGARTPEYGRAESG
jgi:CRISPR type III-B/RAMP module RAMP protein Cmr6